MRAEPRLENHRTTILIVGFPAAAALRREWRVVSTMVLLRGESMAGDGGFTIRIDDLSGAAVQDLLRHHLAGMQATSPAENVFALDLDGLRRPDIVVWTAWRGQAIAAVGALRQLDPAQGEIKSMRAHPDYLGTGAGAALLDHIIATARARGYRRLSLETGRGAAFEPALMLYRRRGFLSGPAFADYVPNAFSQFLHLDLAAAEDDGPARGE